MRRAPILYLSIAVGTMPAIAMAGSKLPQMDFADPLTGAQVVWMAIIMLVLYFLMARWALPQIGGVIEKRVSHIANDLETARQAKAKAEHAVTELNLAIRNARESSQSAIADAVKAAKERARAQSAELNAKLDDQIEQAESDIKAAQAQAVAALAPVAREVTSSLLMRLTGEEVSAERIDRTLALVVA
ncbi:F0F1 ATP synthase subunit B [Acidiphilium sp. PA]|uniref:F0F1 ATP synthase subunit B family protein n=1 Tax=Acidiphilium sp. PA TaxID=2871705 RepID=UPI002244B004|nr:F0F1 ATP synthase subunit B [Acidiphilium sp. PA]MCW8308312.1 F0F1 ATP synthase subunit B [Acidiphilium sp. PA]